MTTTWRTTPLARMLGSAVSWFLFTLCFALLFQSALVVIGLGGSCASGGPYEIAVECPENVAAFTPLSIFGGLAAVGIALIFAQGFGTPLPAWSWAVLFVGLSVPFAIGGGVTGYVLCALFVVMGLVPIVLELRANPLRTFIGSSTAPGEAFVFSEGSRRSLMSMGAPTDGTRVPTFRDGLAGLGIPLVASTLGVLSGMAWF